MLLQLPSPVTFVAIFMACHIAIVNALPTALHINKRELSPTVQTPSPEYVKLLNHSILFFEAQRSGRLPTDNRVPWRHDSGLSDGQDASVDLSGGYYDAGDYLKFTFPLSYTTFMLCWGGTDFIQGYQMANQTDYLRSQVKWATDWLIKAHPGSSTLFVQVGDVERDNESFGPDSEIPSPRPSYQINETYFGTDAAAMAATAFAGASVFFNNLVDVTKQNEDDRKYADTLLKHATELYNASISIKPYTKYQQSVPSMKHAYSSSEYIDELLLAGVVLYRATKKRSYLDDTFELYRETKGASSHAEPLDWDNKWGALYVLLAETMLEDSDQSEAQQVREEAEAYLDGIVGGTTANKTNGGLLFWDAYSTENSNSIAMSASFMMLFYSKKVLRPLADKSSEDRNNMIGKAMRYEELANGQLDYIFGKNPLKQNYVVGERSNSPKFPHSAPASGFISLKEAIKNPQSLSHSHTIYGALVGGPSKNDSFADVRLDWSQTEVALDYNAPYQNILAYQVMYSSTDPFYIVSTDSGSKPYVDAEYSGSNRMPSWGFALAIVLPILAVIGILIGAFIFVRRRQRDRKIQEGLLHAPRKSENIAHQQQLGNIQEPNLSTGELANINTRNTDEASSHTMSAATCQVLDKSSTHVSGEGMVQCSKQNSVATTL